MMTILIIMITINVDFYENHEEYNDEYDVDDPPGE